MNPARCLIALMGIMPLVYWTGFLASSTTPKWLVMSAFLPMIAFYADRPPVWKTGAAFLVWSALTCFWALSLPMALDRLWLFTLIGLAFVSGSMLTRDLYREGVAMCLTAMGLNGVVILGGLVGVDFLTAIFDSKTLATTDYAGLFINRNRLAAAAMAIAVPGFVLWKWRVFPVFAIALLSKAAMVGGLVALVSAMMRLRRWRTALIICAVAGLSATGYIYSLGVDKLGERWLNHQHFQNRVALYLNTAATLDITGRGVGSYFTGYPLIATAVTESPGSVFTFDRRPRTAHNDALTIGFETGLIGMALFVSLVVIIIKRPLGCKEDWAAWAGIMTILGMGLVAFPLYTPFPALLFGIQAGFLCRERPN
jgi:hypothetical protein